MCKKQNSRIEHNDTYEEAATGLNEALAATHDLIMANQALIMANQESNERQFAELRQMIAELHHKADATMKHQDVPYEKSTMGFMKED